MYDSCRRPSRRAVIELGRLRLRRDQADAPFAQVLAGVYGIIAQQAVTMAYADCQWALGALTFLLLPLVFVLPRRRKGAAPVTVALD